MKIGVPWSVKGIRPEARETAKEAARRSGMSLSDWLNSVILHTAAEQGVDADDGDEDTGGEDTATVHDRIDELTRKIDQLGRGGPEAYAPRRSREQYAPAPAASQHAYEQPQMYAPAPVYAPPQQVYAPPSYAQQPQFPAAAQLYAPPAPQAFAPAPPQFSPPAPRAYAPASPQFSPPALPQFSPPASPGWTANLDNAVAEIAARRRALNGEATPQPARAPSAAPQFPQPSPAAPIAAPEPPRVEMFAPPAPLPAQDLSGLEEQLRRITDQIDTLRYPGVEESINALRGELAEIGHSLSDAMPRQAIDAIERQIQSLTHRVAEGRQAGVDTGALSNIEHGLAEVRDALYNLTPAESLVGFNEAIHGLAQKIDLIVAEKDPATLQQLETAVSTLRQISTHIASNDAVSRVASDVTMLAEKIDRIAHAGAGSDALSGLEHRISALSDALAARSQHGVTVPPQLEALVGSLTEKIEQLQNSRGDDVAFGHLENRIVKLVEKLDASDSRLGHLETIERGLADLLVQLEEMRAHKGESSGLRAGAVGVDTLKSDIARTQDQINAVHGTLGQVVDRLAMIEQGIRGGNAVAPAAPPMPMPVGRLAVRAVPHEQFNSPLDLPESAIQEAPPAPPPPPAPPAPQSLPAARQFVASPPLAPVEPPMKPPLRAKSAPINPDLPPDQPLEPGSGLPHFRADPAARIAASEAALGSAAPEPEAAPLGKSGFIAAARRAAQAALKDKTPRAPLRMIPEDPIEHADNSMRQKLSKRIKSLFVAASVIAIVIGAVQLGAGYFVVSQQGEPGGKPGPKVAQTVPADNDTLATGSAGELAAGNTTLTSQQTAGAGLAPVIAPPIRDYGMGTLLSPPGSAAIGSYPSGSLLQKTEAADDFTGSVSGAARRKPAGGSEPVIAAPATVPTDDLPLGISSPNLRKAAIAGDAGAAYEIGLRLAEGRGVPASPANSVRWFERAARQGLAPAQFHLGSMYEKGQGTKKDLDKARQNYLAAATQGNAKAMHNLAVLYAEGLTGKPDFDVAAGWFRKAALRGIADSQYNLAVLCARGLGTAKDLGKSYKWFALAADQGDKEAAKKRDDVATRLDAKELAAARQAIKTFSAEPQPVTAINVPQPPGGWDAAPPAGRKKAAAPITLGQR